MICGLRSHTHSIPHGKFAILQAVGMEKWYNVCVLKMCMMDEIRAKRDEIYAIARKHKAEKLWVFGSCARREERPDSDVDFLVKFSDDASGFASVRIRRELESLLRRNTDVVSYGCIEGKPQYWFSRNVRRDMLAV